MKLSRALAQQIVNVLSATVQFPMGLVDTEATILAGRALSKPGMLLSDQADGAEHLHQTTIPVRYAGESVGAIIVHTEAAHVAPVAPFVQTIAESLIHQIWQFELVVHQQWLRDRFLFQLLHRALDRSHELVEHEAAMLGIDFCLPRIVIVIDIADPGRCGPQLLTTAQRMIGRHERICFAGWAITGWTCWPSSIPIRSTTSDGCWGGPPSILLIP